MAPGQRDGDGRQAGANRGLPDSRGGIGMTALMAACMAFSAIGLLIWTAALILTLAGLR